MKSLKISFFFFLHLCYISSPCCLRIFKFITQDYCWFVNAIDHHYSLNNNYKIFYTYFHVKNVRNTGHSTKKCKMWFSLFLRLVGCVYSYCHIPFPFFFSCRMEIKYWDLKNEHHNFIFKKCGHKIAFF